MTAEQQGRPVLRPADLSVLERTYLGVLDTGMVPARLAGDRSLRMDVVTAVCLALREGKPEGAYLGGQGDEPEPAFFAELTAAALSLDEKGVISVAAPPPEMIVAPEGLQPRTPPRIDFDQHPRIWDRYLAHLCMEELFGDGRVYPFLMGKYQDSAEVWARLYQERPERFL